MALLPVERSVSATVERDHARLLDCELPALLVEKSQSCKQCPGSSKHVALNLIDVHDINDVASQLMEMGMARGADSLTHTNTTRTNSGSGSSKLASTVWLEFDDRPSGIKEVLPLIK